MATSTYLNNRKRYQRPQGILWSENPGTLVEGVYIPDGYEVGANVPEGTNPNLIDQFLILSDHNRGEISFQPQRIEQRQRTVNGRMRSYHIADKNTINVNWTMLPSRSFNKYPNFTTSGAVGETEDFIEYTADGGAGGAELLQWYETHKGSFWMYLAYDKYTNFVDGEEENSRYEHLAEYNQIIEVYITDFSYSISRRGGSNHDLWNISVTMEEV